jgi:phage repressor protein C with HTH and peptisase S24 domain
MEKLLKNNNFERVRHRLNLSNRDFSSKLNISETMYSKIKRGDYPIGDKVINKIKRAIPLYNIEWLLYGFEPELSKLKEVLVKEPQDVYEVGVIPIKKKHLEEKVHSAPYYENVSASAGLSFLMDNNSPAHAYIKIPGIGVDAYINVFGDSMYPKYCSGEIIGIKRIGKEAIFFGYAYVIEMLNGEAYIKYIRQGRDDDHWSLESENEKFQSKDFRIEDIRSVYKIKSVITRTGL